MLKAVKRNLRAEVVRVSDIRLSWTDKISEFYYRLRVP